MPKEKIYSKGEAIGPYEVVRVLATGGMGILYEATPDPARRADLLRMGIRRVALKMARLDALPDDREQRKRLVDRIDREFRTLLKLSRLDLPDVVQVYDFGFDEGVPYYVMALVEGITLAEALEERPRLGEILAVFAKLCAAMVTLHDVGICHRDLKPSNVMLRNEGGDPVLIDFGICQAPAERTLTGPREALGTPLYWSPEYVKHRQDPDQDRPYIAAPTDDVWALGIILYEILTGGGPWRSSPDEREALLKEIRKVTPPHPCDVNPKAPRALGDLAMRLLEKNDRKRPRNASEVVTLLGRAAEGSDVLSRIPERRSASRPFSPGELAARGHGGGRRTAPSRKPRGWIAEHLPVIVTMGFALFVLGYSAGHTERNGGHARARPAATNAAVDLPKVGRETVSLLAAGLPMPSEPKPNWLRPPCVTPGGQRMPGVDILRGVCWEVTVNPSYIGNGPRLPCPENAYDPPPEATAEQKRWCFRPVEVKSSPPQAVMPKTK